MSERDNLDQNLPLPAPRSPRALDERIRAYARERAPQKGHWYHSRWAAGLATAGVAGVAVLLALQSPEWSPQPALYDSPPQREATAGGGSAQRAEPATAAAASPEWQRSVEEPLLSAGKPAAPAPAADEAASPGLPASKAAAQARGEYYEREAAAALGAMQEAGIAAEALRDGAAGRRRELVAACLALLQQGDAAGAARCYQALRDTCRDCALPPTLEEAREALRAGAADDD